MKKVDRFVIWICSRFTRSEIEQIIQSLNLSKTSILPRTLCDSDSRGLYCPGFYLPALGFGRQVSAL